MNSVQAQNAIEGRMKENFNRVWASQPTVYIRPEGVGVKTPEPPYIDFYIRHLTSVVKGYGGNTIEYRRFGMIWGQVYIAKNIGMTMGRKIANVIQTIFEGQQFGGITCREFMLVELGDDWSRAELTQVNAKVLFDYDETVTY